MAKSHREKIKMKSAKSAHHYFTTKNKNNTTERLVLKKFDPLVRERAEYKETK